MAEVLYNSFRLNATARVGGGSGFFAISELAFFDDVNKTGNSLLKNGIATASSSYGSGFEPSKAFDSDESTRWSSASASSAWLRYDLSAPVKKPKSVYILLNSSPTNAPVDFSIEGSTNGGTTWQLLYNVVGFASSSQYNAGVYRNITLTGLKGVAKKTDGTPASRVFIYDWLSGALKGSAIPDIQGQWSFSSPDGRNDTFLVVVVSDVAYGIHFRPQAHGPISLGALE